jgi:hypothetical protein|tara:strand:+ start:227 stop:733 length:507 start_codon:yes stop_codon:yes gene_type:complete
MFFSQFPIAAIEVEGQLINYPDIFRRVAVNDLFKNLAYIDTYTVQDGEKPEHIAYRLYENAQYHWIVILANNITNMHKEWPKSHDDLISMCKDKYGDNEVYGTHHYAFSADRTVQTDYDEAKVSSGEIVSVSNYDYEARLNDDKSEIQLLKPEYVQQFIGQFKQLIKK